MLRFMCRSLPQDVSKVFWVNLTTLLCSCWGFWLVDTTLIYGWQSVASEFSQVKSASVGFFITQFYGPTDEDVASDQLLTIPHLLLLLLLNNTHGLRNYSGLELHIISKGFVKIN